MKTQTHTLTSRLALGLLLALASAFGHALPSADADVNQDDAVNVLDLQRLLTGMFAETSAPGAADLNGDGLIDVLDLQLLIAHTHDADAPESPEQPVPAPVGMLSAQPQPYQPRVLALAPNSHPPLPPAQAHPGVRRGEVFPTAQPSTLRFLFQLTPHAPPRPIVPRTTCSSTETPFSKGDTYHETLTLYDAARGRAFPRGAGLCAGNGRLGH
jgi:hypothetical protein